MIGVIISEKIEFKNLIKIIKTKIIEFNGFTFYIGNVKKMMVVICFCGVGKANAAAATMNMIINFKVDKILNIGVCGSLNMKVGEIIIASALVYADVDLTAFGYKLGQLPNEPYDYKIDSKNIDFLKSILSNETYHIGTIATLDSIVSIENIETFSILSANCILGFDMEAAAIAQVCNTTKTNFLCLKIISDSIDIKNNQKEMYKNFLKNADKEMLNLILIILKSFADKLMLE